jgi:ribonuclease BN (tRNA processing enzyme)
MPVKLIVLGKYSPFAPARGACPGYWVSAECGHAAQAPGVEDGAEGAGILLDCGPGVLARFQEYVGPLRLIRSVILSHLHFDHVSDFYVLRYAATPDRRYKELPPRLTVYAPAAPESEFSLLRYRETVEARAIEPGSDAVFGDLKVSFYPGEHPVQCYAVRIDAPDGVLAYSGDSRPCDALVQAASGADLFLCEASAIEADAQFAAPGHLTARQAGEIAAQAGVKRLLLTHLWPFYDEAQILKECREVFPAAQVAEEGASYGVS